jgi:hypothetical protein
MPKISFLGCLEVPEKFLWSGVVMGSSWLCGHTNFVLGWSWAVTKVLPPPWKYVLLNIWTNIELFHQKERWHTHYITKTEKFIHAETISQPNPWFRQTPIISLPLDNPIIKSPRQDLKPVTKHHPVHPLPGNNHSLLPPVTQALVVRPYQDELIRLLRINL